MASVTAFARERITVSSTVKQLTTATFKDTAGYGASHFFASKARLVVKGADIYFTTEGTDPSVGSSVGTFAKDGTHIWLDGLEAIQKFKAIRADATDASVEVTYYR
jgi:hypothetical protein